MKTNRNIPYHGPNGHIATIPKGTGLSPVTNLPNKFGYWAHRWEEMSEEAESYHRNYGFLVDHEDAENETNPFTLWTKRIQERTTYQRCYKNSTHTAVYVNNSPPHIMLIAHYDETPPLPPSIFNCYLGWLADCDSSYGFYLVK